MLNNGFYGFNVQNGTNVEVISNAKSKKRVSGDLNDNSTACVYKPYDNTTDNYKTYSKDMITNNAARLVGTEGYRQVQNNLKILGFYNASAASDGDRLSAESIKAVNNFRAVYGITGKGAWDQETEDKLTEVMNEYNKVYKSAGVAEVAQIKNGYSDYNEAVLKNNISKIWAFLKVGMKLDNVHASAVMGNIMEESGASSTCVRIEGQNKLFNNSYTYDSKDDRPYGILQWRHWERKT